LGGASVVVAKARPAAMKATSTILSLDEGTWKVKPDPVAFATGLKSVFSLPSDMYKTNLNSKTPHFAFSDPEVGRMIVTYSDPAAFEKLIAFYDLKESDPIRTIRTKGDATMATLNAKGDRVAILYPAGVNSKASIEIYTFEGKLQNRYENIPIATNKASTIDFITSWVGFDKTDRLLLYTKDWLRLFDKEMENTIFSVRASFHAIPRLSPGRQWLYGLTQKSYEFYDVSNGQLAGRLKLPDGWEDYHKMPHVNENLEFAMDPTGQYGLYHAFTYPRMSNHNVGVIDMSTGKTIQAGELKNSGVGFMRAHFVALNENTMMLQSGLVFNLRSLKPKTNYQCDRNYIDIDGYYPDKRFWRILQPKPDLGAKLATKVKTASNLYFVASSTPTTGATDGPESDGKIPWPVGTPIRIEAAGYGGTAHLNSAAEQLASAIASRGFPIDPESKNILRVTTDDPNKVDTSVAATKQEVRNAGKEPAAINYQWRKTVSGTSITARVGVVAKGTTESIGSFNATSPENDETQVLSRILNNMFLSFTAGGTNDEWDAINSKPPPAVNAGIDGVD
jgi:hypothetical protein